MKWYRKLYIGESINQGIDEIISDIEVNKNTRKKFLITLPANDKNMLDIITAGMGILVSWRNVYVIGVAGSRMEAVNMTSEILTSVYNETGDFRLKEIFNDFV